MPLRGRRGQLGQLAHKGQPDPRAALGVPDPQASRGQQDQQAQRALLANREFQVKQEQPVRRANLLSGNAKKIRQKTKSKRLYAKRGIKVSRSNFFYEGLTISGTRDII